MFLRRPITVNVVNWLDGQHIVNVIIWNQCCSEMFDFRLFVLHENTKWVRFSLGGNIMNVDYVICIDYVDRFI